MENVSGEYLPKEDEMLEELKKIRTLLEPKPAPVAPAPKGLWAEFIDFLSKYRVMGLAVAFIIGIYLGALVQALVTDLIMPFIGLVIPGLENLATYEIPVASPEIPGRAIHSSTDNLHNRCLRDLHTREDYKEMGHRIAATTLYLRKILSTHLFKFFIIFWKG